jgi:hypothetical protein
MMTSFIRAQTDMQQPCQAAVPHCQRAAAEIKAISLPLIRRLAGNPDGTAANLAVGAATAEPLLPLLDDRV